MTHIDDDELVGEEPNGGKEAVGSQEDGREGVEGRVDIPRTTKSHE